MTKLIDALCDYANAKKNDKGYRDVKENKTVEGNLETWSPSNNTIGENFRDFEEGINGWWRHAGLLLIQKRAVSYLCYDRSVECNHTSV
jgi:hypothetical protein